MSDHLDDDDVGLQQLLKRYGAEDTAEEGSQAAAEAPEEGSEGDTSGEPEEGAEEGSEGSTAPEEKLADDDHVVTLKVGDEERKVPVSELKALWAQEAAIKARDTETQVALKKLNEEGDKAVSILQTMHQQALQEYQQFKDLDTPAGWADARAKLPDAAFQQLTKDVQAARQKVQFLNSETGNFMARLNGQRQEQHKAAIKSRDEALSADKDFKDGWAKAKPEIVEYVTKQGLPADVLDTVPSAVAVKLLWKAMAYDRGATKVAATVKPVATSAAKVLKPGSKPSADSAKTAIQKLQDKVRSTGSVDDAAAVFAARFGGN